MRSAHKKSTAKNRPDGRSREQEQMRGRMNYQEALAYIQECRKYGSVPGLENTRELLRRLGNPQEGLKFVHIAGTNGKGSVLAMVSSVLTESGYKTGRYLSPWIFTYRESFQIDGKPICKADLGRYMSRVAAAAEEMAAEGLAHPTAFEMETALSLLWFWEKGCDIVVLETGLGGLLDATNVIPAPQVCVLTSIGMDHMAVLGETLAEIAAQKAGIIKPGSRVVSIQQAQEAMRVIEDACASCGCPLRIADPKKAAGIRYGLEWQKLSYGGYRGLTIQLSGRYQIDNCVLAVEALRALMEAGWDIPEEKLRSGLQNARWPGRFQVIGKKPLFLVDGAHNEDGARRLAESIAFHFTNKRILYIIGILKDKDAEAILRLTCPAAEAIIAVATPGNPRAMPALELAQLARRFHPNVTAADSLEEAVEMAKLLAGADDVIVAFGTLSFQGDLIKIVEKGTVRSDTHGK